MGEINGPIKTLELILIKHGECEWEERMLFTGWYDSPLTERGRKQAKDAGVLLKNHNYQFDIAFTSFQNCAENTLNIILEELDQTNISVVRTWRLNERHCGALTGRSISNINGKYNQIQFKKWTKSYTQILPPMEPDHPYYTSIFTNPKYNEEILGTNFRIPQSESMKIVSLRVSKVWVYDIVPILREGKSVLICGHTHSLRGIMQILDSKTTENIMTFDPPPATPLVYTLNRETLKPEPPASSFQILKRSKDVRGEVSALEQHKIESKNKS